MKRSLTVFLLLIIFSAGLLTGCHEPEPVLRDSFEADITVDGEPEISARMIRTPDTLTVTLTSPATLAGLSYTYRGDELTTSYSSYSCITDVSALPSAAFPAILREVSNNISHAVYLSSDDCGDTFTLPTSHGDIRIILSDGLPVTISGDDLPYTITTA